MKKIKQKHLNILIKPLDQNGYALLFTVILVSIISLISIGLSNTTYKQLMLSSGASDSQSAFYESDMAMECALYIDNETTALSSGAATFTCGVDEKGKPYILNIGSNITNNITTYQLTPPSTTNSSTDSCFRITIIKNNETTAIKTSILANGFNICDKTNPRTVERTIKVSY